VVRRSLFIGMCLLVGFLVACAAQRSGTTHLSSVIKHPQLSKQEKLVPCAQCHKENTPDIYEEWFKSYHGLDNVKCFQCHGTFGDFHVTPPVAKCEACHAREVETLTAKKACWDCHSPHLFKCSPNTPKGHR